MSNTITVDRDDWRALVRLERKVVRAKMRKAAQAQRKAYWSQVYWAQALRFETFKVGGLRFIKLGSLSVSICFTTPKEQSPCNS